MAEAAPPPIDPGLGPYREDEGVAEAAPPPYRVDHGVAEAAPPPVAQYMTGSVTIQTRPRTEVFIDGRRYGKTPIVHLALPARKHQVRLVNQQEGIDERRILIIEADKEVRLNLVLKKK